MTEDAPADAAVPRSLAINAWAGGDGAVSGAAHDPGSWSLFAEAPGAPPQEMLFAEEAPDLTRWQDERVGWGLVLPETDLSPAEKARGDDAPGPIRELLQDRQDAPVLRYLKESSNRFNTLLRYTTDGKAYQPDISSSAFGIAPDQIPYYLLICGSPEEIPWDLQYALSTRFAVGRLDLSDAGLANYVSALRSGWSDSAGKQDSAIVWTTDHGDSDMSHTMRLYLAEPLWNLIHSDNDIGPNSVLVDKANGGATVSKLVNTLSTRSPGMVMTTSHGVTYPLDDTETLAANLGLLVGEDLASANPQDILAHWQPDGAIWYAHACCSAGCRGDTIFEDLVQADSPIGEVLRSVAHLGSMTAPLPSALLGSPRPLRAFVGHVEPTFDWSIRQPDTRQGLANGITEALWTRLFERSSCPIGHAFRTFYSSVGALATQQVSLKEAFNHGDNVDTQLLQVQLRARDIASTVILGDPTVRLALVG